MNLAIYIFLLFCLITGCSDFNIISSLCDVFIRLIFLIISILFISYSIIKKFDIFINFSTLWFAFQRYIGLIMCNYSFISINTFKNFFLLKDIFFIYSFFILLILFLMRKIKKVKLPLLETDKFLILYCILLLLYTLFSTTNIWLRLLSLRRFIILPLVYFIGRMAIINFNKIISCLKYTIIFTYVICIYGLIDYFFARTYIYQHLFNVYDYFNKQVLAGFIPIQWLGDDVMRGGIFIDYTFGEFPRFITTFIEPTTLGSFLAFVLLFAVFQKDIIKIKPIWIKHILNMMLFLSILLTFSKGAFTILLFGSAFILNYNKRIPKIIRSGYFYSVIAVFGIGITLILLSASGASAHINGLKTGLMSAITHPLGLGLGNAGNFANLLGDNNTESIGGESAIGSMLGQLGFVGFTPYLLFVIFLIKTLSKKIQNSSLFIVIAGAFLGYSVNSMFTDSALGVTGNFYYFLFAGLFVSQAILFEKKGYKYHEKSFIHNS